MSSETQPNSQPTQETFKDQLDKAAKEAHHPTSSHKESNSPSLVEKVAEYVPAASKLLGVDKDKNDQDQSQEVPPKDLTGPPHRPLHDDHIAEFIREQHRSKKPEENNEA
ncbi:hypothetical protein F4678DRAFT_438156 [Xylaria arbuscula]|nr:hypothetical protein F4678DRAFT_438156 [Xylaria arbuscula]